MSKEIKILPLEHSRQEAIKIYAKRLGVFFAVVFVNIFFMAFMLLVIKAPLLAGYTIASVLTIWAAANLIKGGAQWITSGGDSYKGETTRKLITKAMVGLIIGLTLWIFLFVISR